MNPQSPSLSLSFSLSLSITLPLSEQTYPSWLGLPWLGSSAFWADSASLHFLWPPPERVSLSASVCLSKGSGLCLRTAALIAHSGKRLKPPQIRPKRNVKSDGHRVVVFLFYLGSRQSCGMNTAILCPGICTLCAQ